MNANVKILTDLLLNSKVDKAAEFILELKEKNATDLDTVIYLSSDLEEAGLAAYSLTQELLKRDNDPIWHKLSRDILSNNLCHFRGAYAIALFHARIYCDLVPTNESALETYLDIGANRTEMLSQEERNAICIRLRNLNPENAKARIYFR
jgi:hypothetical protein